MYINGIFCYLDTCNIPTTWTILDDILTDYLNDISELLSSYTPVIDVQKQVKPGEIVPVSPSNITYYTIPAVGTSSGQQANSNIVFNIIPPVSDAVMSRLIRIRLQFQVNVTGAQQSNVLPAGVTPNVFNSPYCGFAAFPINSVFSTLTLQINNASTTIRPSQVIKDLLRYDDPEKLYMVVCPITL